VVNRDTPSSGGVSWWPLVVLCLSLVVVSIQTSVLNVALPTFVFQLGAGDSQLQWITDSYVVAFAGLLLTGAALADRFGRRGVMTIGLIICGGASAIAATANSPGELIVWRTIMGVGAALVMPGTLSILVHVYVDPRQRRKAIAYWSLMNAVGSFIGPITGGLILRWTSWRGCFLITVPFVILSVILGHFLLPTSRDASAARFDFFGAILSTAGLTALVWAIIEGPNLGWSATSVVAAITAAAGLGPAFVWWELHTRSPMLDLAMFRHPQLRAAAIALLIAFVAMSSTMYLASLALQLVQGDSPLTAAVKVSAPITIVNLIVVPRSPWLIGRFGTRTLVSGGIAAIAVSSLVIATVGRSSSYVVLCIGFAMMALAFSTFVPASTEAIMTAAPTGSSGGASAINELVRQFGQALGVALGGGLAAVGYKATLSLSNLGLSRSESAKAHLSLSDALNIADSSSGGVNAGLRVAAQSAYVHGIHLALIAGAVAALVGAGYAALAIPAKHRLVTAIEAPMSIDDLPPEPSFEVS
jgi:EmrB/QacA subfamily drug resistance transporter